MRKIYIAPQAEIVEQRLQPILAGVSGNVVDGGPDLKHDGESSSTGDFARRDFNIWLEEKENDTW